MAGATFTVSESNFEQDVILAADTVVVDFWAEWCGPCKMVAPTLEEIASEKSDELRIGKLNVDENPGLAQAYEVQSIPTMIVFQGGKPAARIVGAKSKAALLADLQPFLANA